jgi:nucleoside-diphosphate-sugar epimerase
LAVARLLVVGGTGFIGKAVCKAGEKLGMAVTSLSLNASYSPKGSITYLCADISDLRRLEDVLHGRSFDYVVNCGGYIDHRLFRSGGWDVLRNHFVGLQYLVRVVQSMPLKKFVHIGSSDEYGLAIAPQSESLRESPNSPYSASKVAATHFLQMLSRTDKFPAVVLRIFLTYGPGQGSDRFLPQVIRGCLNDVDFPVSAGTQLRDFCYIDDVVDGIYRAMFSENSDGKVFNLASGVPVSVRTVIEKIQNMTGGGKPKFGQLAYRPNENMELWADAALITEVLGWKATTSLEDGLSKTISFYESDLSE